MGLGLGSAMQQASPGAAVLPAPLAANVNGALTSGISLGLSPSPAWDAMLSRLVVSYSSQPHGL